MGADILTEIRAAGITLSVDGGNLVATPKVALTDKLRSLIRAHKSTLLKAIAHPDPLPPLPPAAASRRQRVIDMLRDGRRYAVLVENATSDPIILSLATPDGTCEILIPKDRYNPFAVLEKVKGWEREDADPDPSGGASQGLPTACHPWHPGLWWRVAIQESSGRTIEVDAPSGWTLAEWQDYADEFHAPGCTVTAIAGVTNDMTRKSSIACNRARRQAGPVGGDA